MQREDLITKTRERLEMCRRLRNTTTDSRAAGILLEMIAEGEAELQRLLVQEAPLSPSQSNTLTHSKI